MKKPEPESLIKGTLPFIVPAIAAIFGSFLGFIGGVQTASVEGDKAIELEEKKFEYSLIREVLQQNEDKEDVTDELDFMVRIGVIEILNSNVLRDIQPGDIPSFREASNYNVYANQNWGELHEAAAVWDVQTGREALSRLVERFGSNKCIGGFANDMLVVLNDLGESAFKVMSLAKDHYNEFGCDLPYSGYFPVPQYSGSSNVLPSSGSTNVSPMPAPMPDIPPYRQR
ncbi:hypothetical protein IQ254_11725 [Nodosilinea sp. LEGE 07088]|uniref:hypothetical protein n=1 Tax=Nodosilinea sp. LEGE 07088 TaxID=2777968 RepID=UPI00188239E5|nr:hypothetical protein [Nodosilinea sp. LEGE 07088]MBE9137854.1 hypothetical protein [Nodosilinea sp. LEGE 07088]